MDRTNLGLYIKEIKIVSNEFVVIAGAHSPGPFQQYVLSTSSLEWPENWGRGLEGATWLAPWWEVVQYVGQVASLEPGRGRSKPMRSGISFPSPMVEETGLAPCKEGEILMSVFQSALVEEVLGHGSRMVSNEDLFVGRTMRLRRFKWLHDLQ